MIEITVSQPLDDTICLIGEWISLSDEGWEHHDGKVAVIVAARQEGNDTVFRLDTTQQ